MSNDFTLTHVSILVDDQDKAVEFYRDIIGFEVRQDMPFLPEARWLTVGPAAQPGLEILLETPAMNPSTEASAAARTRLDSRAQGTLIFSVPDVTALFERLQSAGAEVEQPLIDQPYGMRDCGFADPWGNHLRFAQPLG
ncbi:VOC family protein [Nocardia sp. IFM 10818]